MVTQEIEAPLSSVEQSDLEDKLKLLDKKLRSLEMVDILRDNMGVKPYTTVQELQENLLLPSEIPQWYDKGYDRHKFIRAILNLKAWTVGSCWIPLDVSEMYLKDLHTILIDRIPHSFSPEVKEAFLEHLDLILDWFYSYQERPTLEKNWQVIYEGYKQLSYTRTTLGILPKKLVLART